MRGRSQDQQMQQDNRERTSGKYARGPQCELCGKPAGWDYCSASGNGSGGYGFILCQRKRCAGQFTGYADSAARARELIVAQGGYWMYGEWHEVTV